MSATISFRRGRPGDASAIHALYRIVAERSGGLARYPDEITLEYINGFMAESAASGIQIVAVDEAEHILGELHAYRSGLRRFDHVLSSLTVAVHPDTQGQGIGRRLFEQLFAAVEPLPAISRIELFAQESNARGRRLYESLGFRPEGRFEAAIQRTEGDGLEADIPMAWTRPAAVR